MNLDIHQLVSDFFPDLKDVINLYNLDRDHQNYIHINDLYNFSDKYYDKISQNLIQQNKFKFVKKLNVINSIDNIDHLEHILVLDCCSGSIESKIDQKSIDKQKKLIKLDVFNNLNVFDVNHLIHLKKLKCHGKSTTSITI